MQLHSNQTEVVKARRGDSSRLDALLAAQERRIRKAFIAFINNARSPKMRADFQKLIAASNVAAATKLVEDHITALARVLPLAFVDVATSEVAALGVRTGVTKAAPSLNFSIAVGFDPSNPRAAALMRTRQLQFVQQITDTQRAAIRSALADAARDGATSRQITQAFVGSIGLTQSQVEAVNRYRTLLESGSAEALNRELRDRRYDRTVGSAIDSGEPLDGNQIDRMVDRYNTNMLNMRADTISLTEGLSVLNEARQEAMSQVIDQAGFDRSGVRRTWKTVGDNRVRHSHAEMEGQTVGMDEPFVAPSGEELMFPGDPSASAGERIRCRCQVLMDFA